MAAKQRNRSKAETLGDEYIAEAVAWARQARRRPARNCKFISHVAGEFIDRLSRPPEGFELSATAVARVCHLIENMPHVKGRQFTGTIELMAWQLFHFANVFGWTNKETGMRKHSISFCQMAKKNGKSTMAAPVGLYMLSPLEGERGAEVYCAASKRDQAGIVLNLARDMLHARPSNLKWLNMSVWARHIECGGLGAPGKMTALSSDTPQTDDGINPSCVILDEIHAMTDNELRNTLMKGTVARDNGLIYEISTAGELRDNSPCLEENRKAKQWVSGKVDLPEFYAMIFEQDDTTSELKKPATWCKSNPSLGVTVQLDKLEVILKDAVDSPSARNQFVQKHFNMFTGSTESWINMPAWEASMKPASDKPDGLELFMGIDLSAAIDLTAVGYCWIQRIPPKKEGEHEDFEYWIGADCFTTKLSAKRNDLIEQYVAQGYIEQIGDMHIDQDYIRDHIYNISKTEAVVEIGFDPWNADQLAMKMSNDFDMVEVRQGARSYSEPMKAFEGLLHGGKIHIIGNPAITWQAANLEIKVDTNANISPIKTVKKNKVDALVAILIAFVRVWRYTQIRPIMADDIVGKPPEKA